MVISILIEIFLMSRRCYWQFIFSPTDGDSIAHHHDVISFNTYFFIYLIDINSV